MEYDALKQPDRITHEYNMLMSSMHVSVGKHLLDPYFTVIWANDFFYEKTGYGREEYEATFHNHVSEYYSAFPDVYETMGKFIKTALKHGEPSYEFVCPMPVKGGSRIWIKVVGTFTKESGGRYPCYLQRVHRYHGSRTGTDGKSITYDNLPGFIAKFQIRAGCAQERFTFLDANDRFIDFFGVRAAGDAPYSFGQLGFRAQPAGPERTLPGHAGRQAGAFPPFKRRRYKTMTHGCSSTGTASTSYRAIPVYLFIYIDITDITEQRYSRRSWRSVQELRNALEMAERANRAKSDFLSRMSTTYAPP